MILFNIHTYIRGGIDNWSTEGCDGAHQATAGRG